MDPPPHSMIVEHEIIKNLQVRHLLGLKSHKFVEKEKEKGENGDI